MDLTFVFLIRLFVKRANRADVPVINAWECHELGRRWLMLRELVFDKFCKVRNFSRFLCILLCLR